MALLALLGELFHRTIIDKDGYPWDVALVAPPDAESPQEEVRRSPAAGDLLEGVESNDTDGAAEGQD